MLSDEYTYNTTVCYIYYIHSKQFFNPKYALKWLKLWVLMKIKSFTCSGISATAGRGIVGG